MKIKDDLGDYAMETWKYVSLVFITIATICFSSCGNKQEKRTEEKQVGKYVYVDQSGCLHTDKHCRKIRFNHDDGGNSSNYQVNFVRTSSLEGNEFTSYCSVCVTDEMYEQIVSVITNGTSIDMQYADTVVTEIDDTEDVYICTSEKAKAYHCDVTCSGLNRCSEALEVMSEQKAKRMGRHACRACYK